MLKNQHINLHVNKKERIQNRLDSHNALLSVQKRHRETNKNEIYVSEGHRHENPSLEKVTIRRYGLPRMKNSIISKIISFVVLVKHKDSALL